jgi:hypothetical protein
MALRTTDLSSRGSLTLSTGDLGRRTAEIVRNRLLPFETRFGLCARPDSDPKPCRYREQRDNHDGKNDHPLG